MPIIQLAQDPQQEPVEATVALVANVELVLMLHKIALTPHHLIPLLYLNVTLSNVKRMPPANPLQMILYLVPKQETQELVCNGVAETVLVYQFPLVDHHLAILEHLGINVKHILVTMVNVLVLLPLTSLAHTKVNSLLVMPLSVLHLELVV